MGIIKKLFSGVNRKVNKKKNEQEKEISPNLSYEEVAEKQVDYDPNQNRASFITDNCEQILETSRQLEEMKVEYQAVTSYLTDMQKIDRIPNEEREQLNDAARKIITLNRERAKYQNNTRKITDVQFKHIDRYEEILPSEIKKMMKNEAYNSTIKNDMRYLEGEKGSLNYQKEDIKNKQTSLKGIAITTCAMVVLLFILFFVITNSLKVNMQIPFLMTILLALASAIYIFTNLAANIEDMKLTERKYNRAITLLNKVKIKYINNTSELDYSYQKFMVNSYAELNYLWDQYIKAKEEEKHYQKNTEELEFHNSDLVKELKRNGVADPDIWIYQAIAIIDNKEMVEVRHRLNARRQKLRERIDYNNSIKERSIKAINKFLTQKPEAKQEVTELLKKFKIDL